MMKKSRKKKTRMWKEVSKLIGTRTPKQCRERWVNHLNPSLKKTPWTPRQEWILFLTQKLLGNRWTEIKRIFTERSENDVKNRWYSKFNKKRSYYHELLEQTQLSLEDCNYRNMNDFERFLVETVKRKTSEVLVLNQRTGFFESFENLMMVRLFLTFRKITRSVS